MYLFAFVGTNVPLQSCCSRCLGLAACIVVKWLMSCQVVFKWIGLVTMIGFKNNSSPTGKYFDNMVRILHTKWSMQDWRYQMWTAHHPKISKIQKHAHKIFPSTKTTSANQPTSTYPSKLSWQAKMVATTSYPKSLLNLFSRNKKGAKRTNTTSSSNKSSSPVITQHFLSSFQYMAAPMAGPLVATQMTMSY